MDFDIRIGDRDAVADSPEAWARVGRAIADRIDELSLLRVEVQRAAGVSDKTLTGYIAGRPIVRADKRRGLCRALGWSDESISRLLNGDPPIPDGAPAGSIKLSASGVDLDELLERDPEAYAAIVEQARIALDRARERGQ